MFIVERHRILMLKLPFLFLDDILFMYEFIISNCKILMLCEIHTAILITEGNVQYDSLKKQTVYQRTTILNNLQ